MNQAAALLNDPSRTVYTYPVQIPYLNQALQELQELFELNNIPVTDTVTSTPIEVPAGVDFIGFAPDPPIANTPYLPDRIIEPKVVWVSQAGENQYYNIQRLDFLPRYDEGVLINQILAFVWQSQEIRFLPANADNDVKLDYIRDIFGTVGDENDVLDVINAASFLEYRTASLMAQFVEQNQTRASSLDIGAALALDRSVGIGTKGRQAINVRHRPFRSNYKRRTYS
jgi:hypothetical protein